MHLFQSVCGPPKTLQESSFTLSPSPPPFSAWCPPARLPALFLPGAHRLASPPPFLPGARRLASPPPFLPGAHRLAFTVCCLTVRAQSLSVSVPDRLPPLCTRSPPTSLCQIASHLSVPDRLPPLCSRSPPPLRSRSPPTSLSGQ